MAYPFYGEMHHEAELGLAQRNTAKEENENN